MAEVSVGLVSGRLKPAKAWQQKQKQRKGSDERTIILSVGEMGMVNSIRKQKQQGWIP